MAPGTLPGAVQEEALSKIPGLFSGLFIALMPLGAANFLGSVTTTFDVQDDQEYGGGFLGSPATAIVFGGKLFIADYNFNVFVFDKQGFVKRIPCKGEGPKQIKFNPNQFEALDGQLALYTNNAFERLVFDEAGNILRKDKLDKYFFRAGEYRFRKTSQTERIAHLKSLYGLDSQCYLGNIYGQTKEDYHLARFTKFASTAQNQALAIIPNGVVEIYNPKNCALLGSFNIPVATFAKEPEIDPIATKIYKMKYGKSLTHMVFGTPIKKAKADGSDLWLLINNEHKVERRFPKEHWALKFDMKQKQVAFKFPLPSGVANLEVSENHLILINGEESFVKAFPLDALNQKARAEYLAHFPDEAAASKPGN